MPFGLRGYRLSDKLIFPYPRVGVVLWVVTPSGKILLQENESLQLELPFEAVQGGEDWLSAVARLRKRFFGQIFSEELAGLAHWSSSEAQEAWAFAIFRVEVSESVQLVKGFWKTSLEGLKLSSWVSPIREMIDTSKAQH